MKEARAKPVLSALNYVPGILFLAVFGVFGSMEPKFLELANFTNILIQSASTIVVATGMTFVLLTAGVDLSVGAAMFLAAAVAGKLIARGQPIGLALMAMLAVGLIFGAVNALFVSRLRIVPFLVTLATLFLGRGLALRITETRAMNLPGAFHQLGAERLWGIPLPILIFAAVVGAAHLVLTRTPYGRQIYAVGADAEGARKAGVPVGRILFSVYLISAGCAALGAIITMSQLGAVSPKFGEDREFAAIAAAVLGGVSLFGGRGAVFPGAVLGAVLIQSVESGLVICNANPYLYKLITSAIIFAAVLLDSTRTRLFEKITRRKIRKEEG